MSSLAEKGGMALAGVYMSAIISFGLVQIACGIIGLEYLVGGLLAMIIAFVCLLLRMMLPLTIGCFFCAYNVFGWHWAFALLLALPGVIFMVPAIMVQIVGSIRRRA